MPKMTKKLKTLADVADYLGASGPTNESISRRVYKDTECGAWAKVEEQPTYIEQRNRYLARYAKIDGAWQLLGISQNGVSVEFSSIPEAHAYFWPGADEMQDYLASVAGGAAEYEASEVVETRIRTGTKLAFLCGSAVEGTDAEVWPVEVSLPCRTDEIDAAIQSAEDEADRIWGETHPDGAVI